MRAAIVRRWAAVVLTVLVAAASVATVATAAKARRAKPAARAAGDSVLVRVGGETITRADVQRRLEEIPEQARATFSTPEGRQQLLERMVEERVWLIAARREGVGKRPQVRQQLEAQERDLLIRTYLGEVMAGNPAPSDSEARAWYDAHRDDYRMPATVTLRHIQAKSESQAKAALKSAQKGEDWAKLVTKYSTDTLTRANGGALGSVTREGRFATIGAQPALAEAGFALGKDKIGGPYKTDRGWHVLKVEDVKEESHRPFETVRATIARQLSTQRSQEFYRERLEQQRKRLGVTPDSTAIKKFVSQKKSAREMFKEAQELGGATERIAAYERLLREYPDSEVSAQAQFMVGFIHSEELQNYEEAEKAFKLVLERYPRSELAASAKWMVEHMRSEDAPEFIPMEADSSRAAAAPPGAGKGSTEKP